MVYEFARVKLRRHLILQFQELGRAEFDKQMAAFEAAVAQLESDISETGPALSSFVGPGASGMLGDNKGALSTDLVVQQASPVALAHNKTLGDVILPEHELGRRIIQAEILPPIAEFDTSRFRRPSPTAFASPFWLTIQLMCAVTIGLGIYVVTDHPSGLFGRRNQMIVEQKAAAPLVAAQSPQAPPPIRLPIPNTPLPTNYGIYAAQGGKLAELQPLPIRVPDPRVSISATISTPSPTTLPTGRVDFVAFRRDLAASAPDIAVVRVVAQIKRALSFEGSRATTTEIPDQWAVRGKSYALKIAPVEGSSEMIVVRPDNADFVFPSGRYALVFKNAAYDFNVAGPVTDPSHCLERTDALGAPVFSECRTP